MGPDQRIVENHLKSARFRAGVARGWWHILTYEFPYVTIAIVHRSPTGATGETVIRFELTNYPVAAPWAQVWNPVKDCLLTANQRPNWDGRTREAFKSWNAESVYRPWDRHALAHNNWANQYPSLAWNATRELSFALEDLYAILDGATRSNADVNAA